jgi:hypothetical protein
MARRRRRDGGHHLVRLGRVAGIVDHHGKAVLGQALGDGGADAARCAGDDSNLFHGLAPSMCVGMVQYPPTHEMNKSMKIAMTMQFSLIIRAKMPARISGKRGFDLHKAEF